MILLQLLRFMLRIRPRPLSGPKRLVFNAVRRVGVVAHAAFVIGLVILIIALEPCDLAVALEGQDVRGQTI